LELLSNNSIAILAFPESESYPRLTRSVLHELHELLEQLAGDTLFRGVVLASNSRSFATGAEIEEVCSLPGPAARDFAQTGQALLTKIACSQIPVVAAIRGFCLGGGLDLALACHARVATFESSLGHPGVTLGLVTGWGGTQRLARLLGKPTALQILLTGERLPATQARTLGLIDELVSSRDLIESAIRWCSQLRSVKPAA
jgi:enoyl-CoA hydratase/carnithine racemase